MKRQLSWSMRFALALSAVFAIGTLLAGGLSYLFLSREMSQRLAADVRSSAESLAQIAANGDSTDLREQIIAQVRSSHDGSSLFAFVDGSTGETLGSLQIAAPFAGPRRLLVGRDIPESNLTEAADAYRAFGIRTGIGWVIAARDEAWVAECGEILVQTTAYSLTAAALLTFGLALVTARRNERRIDHMEQVLDEVGAGHLNRRIRDRGGDDLADLAARVDQTLDRLEAGVESIRQVSTDVAHDLRAPLARLRLRLEPQAMSAAVPQQTRQEIGSALIDIDTISGTFEAILRLARLQSGSVEIRRDLVDLGRLAASTCEHLQAVADEAGHVLEAGLPPEPVPVRGDEDLLAQALTNLVVNAIEHCPNPANIRIAASKCDGVPVLAVADDGPGIPEADRARVLDRFVRLDASRSVPGTGLGLSLVSVIAGRHRARLILEDNAPGLKVSILFPPVVPELAVPTKV